MKPTLTITSSRRRPFGERFIANGFNVFVESNATTLADKFFSENEIYSLRFKCKTWGKVSRMVDKLNIAAMRTVWGPTPVIKYSIYTGCSCPCSPGYRVRKATCPTAREFLNHDVWVKIKVDVSELKAALPRLKEMLKEEIEYHNELAPA